MTLTFANINFLGVIVAGVLFMILGALWYSPFLFGNMWLKMIGKTAEEIQQTSKPSDYLFAFIGALLSALILEILLNSLGVTALGDGLLVGVLVWLGFVAASTLTYTTFEGPKMNVWMLFQGYQLVMYLIAAGLLTLWQ